MIARSRPGIDPSPQIIRDEVEVWCSNPLFPDPPIENVDYGSTGVGSQPMVANDADVSVIASHFTRLIIDTLANPEESCFDNSAYMIGLRKEWIFKAAFDKYPVPIKLPVAAEPLVDLTIDQSNRASSVLLAMIKAHVASGP